MEELTVTLMNVEWEPINACGVIAWNTSLLPVLEDRRQQIRAPTSKVPNYRAYMLTKKEAAAFGAIVTGTLLLISRPFCVLIDLAATYSFISTLYAMQLNVENKETKTNYRINLPNDSRV